MNYGAHLLAHHLCRDRKMSWVGSWWWLGGRGWSYHTEIHGGIESCSEDGRVCEAHAKLVFSGFTLLSQHHLFDEWLISSFSSGGTHHTKIHSCVQRCSENGGVREAHAKLND